MVNLHRAIAKILENAGIPDAELETRWILEDVPEPQAALILAKRRANHEPLQYLLGAWEFYGMRMLVGNGVLIPRADTETLVDAVLSRLDSRKAYRIADLCTGSGCIALALKAHLPQAELYGLELHPEALAYAKKNAQLHGLSVSWELADVCARQTAVRYQALDAIVSNPPYLTKMDLQALQPEVAFEPMAALDGGVDGLMFYRVLTSIWKDALRVGGLLAFEVGIGQAEAVVQILAQHNFTRIVTRPDLGGIDRVVLGYRT